MAKSKAQYPNESHDPFEEESAGKSLPTPHFDFPHIGDLLRRKGIWLDKAKGQHYLKRQEICAAIAEAASLTKNDFVIEVGAGLGNLSVELASRSLRTISIELETIFADWHDYLVAAHEGLSFHYADFLDVDLDELLSARPVGSRFVAAGNLPYQITSQILFRFAELKTPPSCMVFMVQREVAERLAAGTGSRQSGALTYKLALDWSCEILFDVPPEEFLPPPKVHSSVIRFQPVAEPKVLSTAQRARLYKLLDNLFRFRRKTLLNGLQQSGYEKSDSAAALTTASIDPMRRVETLSLDELIALEGALHSQPTV